MTVARNRLVPTLATRLVRIFALLIILAATLTIDSLSGPSLAQQGGQVPGQSLGNQSDSDMWRNLRQGQPNLISDPATGPAIIIQSEGESWRSLRNGPLSYYGGYLLVGVVGILAVFFLLRGRVKIKGGRSGRWVLRFTNAERVTHWYVASLFIMLAVTGLTLMFGKYVILPWAGPTAFGVIATACLQAHNLLGPLFIIGVIVMFIIYVKDNFPTWVDIMWVLKGGFLFLGHAPSGKYNMGEKGWFWWAMLTGVILSLSGLVLDFPPFVEYFGLAEMSVYLTDHRTVLQVAQLLHAAAAILVIAAALGHIYLGTIGVEGALEGMTAGHVDENWAIEHHDKWAEKAMAEQGMTPRAEETPAAAE